jgi:serine/threonine-protein kinase
VNPDEELVKRAKGRLGSVLKGKYRLDSILGFGGMAVVYRATHRNRAQLAVKMLHPELSVNADVRSRFLREGYAANSVNHPGAVLVVDDDVAEDGSAFLVMELLVGETAEAMLDAQHRRLPVPAAVSIVHQLLDVLASAHAAGIVHRDVKPANLLVTRDGTVKVLDFGIARVLETAQAGGQATGGGLPLGTPAYMAPEQAVARSADIDAQTDVWAAGATLFTLVSGELVHDGPTPAQILVYSATRPARSLKEVAPDVSPAIAAVVDRALAFDKKDRWPSAASMRDALADASRAAFGAPPTKDRLAALVPRLPSILPAPVDDEMASAPTLHAGSFPPGGKGASTASPVASASGSAQPRKRARRTLPLALFGLLACALAVGAVRFARRRGGQPSSPDPGAHTAPVQGGPALVLVLDFENETTEPALDGTVETLLEHMLARSPRLSALTGTNLRSSVAEIEPAIGRIDERVGPKMAARWGMRTVTVRGVVSPRHAGVTIEVVAADSLNGTQVAALTETADHQGAVPAAVGRLAIALRTAMGDPPADPVDAAKSGLSSSLEAIREVNLSTLELREGKFEEALAHARLAVKADSSFAEGDLSLGVALYNLGRHSDGQKRLKDAADHLDGLSDYRRLLILSMYHAVMEDLDKAAPEFAEIVARWPFFTSNHLNLAEIYMGMGDVERALSTIREAVALRPRVLEHEDLAQFELAAGHFEASAAEARRIVADFPRHPADLDAWLACAEALQGHREASIEAYKDLEQADPQQAVTAEADFAMFEGRLDDAAQLLEARLAKEETSHSESTAKAWAMLAEVRSTRGDKVGAKEAALHVAAASDASTLFRAARVLARVAPPKQAAEAAASLMGHPGLHARLFSALVTAEARRVEGKAAEAVRVLEEARSLGDFWITHLALGQAELERGAFDEANRELELCSSRSGQGAMALVDATPTLRYLPGVRYALARAREGLGRQDAKDAYEAFLAMEPSAQGDPLVLDARKRVGMLSRTK